MLRGSANYVWWTNQILGEGATGKVFKGVHKNNGTKVAVKTFSEMSYKRAFEIQMREFEVIKKLKHENIVQLFAIEDDQEGRGKVIVMELCTGGSLFNILEDPENMYGLCEKEFLLVLEHLSGGMRHLRDNNLIHRDLKPGNIMKFISEDGNTIYKLIDFGAARELEESHEFMSLYGTEEYLHPDMYERAVLRRSVTRTFGANVDLWSIGVTLYHVATGNLPFRPYGGRKNRETMHLMTTKKASGIISGTQISESGPIEWSRTLPKHCQLSEGLKTLVTPLLAGLLENRREKMWSFDQFFKEITLILSKRVLHVFFMNHTNRIKIFLEPDYKFDAFQEHIYLQTKVMPESQILLFGNDHFKSKVGSSTNAKGYPRTEVERPIFLYSRENNNVQLIPSLELPKFPTFPYVISVENDASLTKIICSVGHEIKRRIEQFAINDALMKTGVEQFIETHKIALKNLLEKTLNLNHLISHVIKLLQILANLSKLAKTLVEELNSLKINFDEVFTRVHQLYERCVTGDFLQQEWESLIYDKNSLCENRPGYRAKHFVDCLLESRKNFLRDRVSKTLTHNDEQFHALEKIKMTSDANSIKLLLDKTQSAVGIMAESLADWYKLAQTFWLQAQILQNDFHKIKTKLDSILDLKLCQMEEAIKTQSCLKLQNDLCLRQILTKFEEKTEKVPTIIQQQGKLLEEMIAFTGTEQIEP